jgi:CheY-like chemotaxis protein
MDDLLDASRITRNKLRLEPNGVALSEVVSAAVEAVRPLMEENAHRLTVSLPSAPVELRADGERLSQVLQNLLRNSAKYTRPGGEISLTCRRSGAVLEAVVEDSGIGISAAEMPGIFELFARSDRAAKEDKNGLGIGLALAKGLIEMHGGSIVGESAGVDEGSRFTITLPLAEGDDTRGAIGDGCGYLEAAGNHRRRGRRILVVDDNADLAASMARMLSMLGHEVITAADGIEGLEAAERYQPDVVFMDIGMPRLDGLEATRRLRAATWGKEIPVVALTGWGQNSDRLQSERAGCDRHLVKPVRLEEFERLLEELRPVARDAPSSA